MGIWNCQKIPLSFNLDWKIARGETKARENLLITYKEGEISGSGEVAFTTGRGESAEKIIQVFDEFCWLIPKNINGLDEMMNVLYHSDLPVNLRFGMESAYIHFLGNLMNNTPQRVLGIDKVNNIKTSYSLPIMDIDEIEDFIKTRNLGRFKSLKLKVSGIESLELVKEVERLYKGNLRIDANEGFKNARDVVAFLEALEGIRIEFLEQPLNHLDWQECIRLKEMTDIPIIADEALQEGEVLSDFARAYDGVNVKLMKSGGYHKALKQLRAAKNLNLLTMVGCMIETSLGIYSAMNIAAGVDLFDLDGFLLLENEPYKLVYENKGKLYYSMNH